jgi:hypothetical protein
MAEDYTWKITLADNSVVTEGAQPYSLAWELPGAVKKVELIGPKEMSADLDTGDFVVDGKKDKPAGVGKGMDKALFFRKRRQVRTDGIKILDARTEFVVGYIYKGELYEAGIQPKIGMNEEKIRKAEKKPKPK